MRHAYQPEFPSSQLPNFHWFNRVNMMLRRNISLIILIILILPVLARAQQGKWQRFGWNPPTVNQKDTNGGIWTYFGSNALIDSSIIMRSISPVQPYLWQNPYSQVGNGFGMQFHFNLDFSLHYKNGLLQEFPFYYGPRIDPQIGYRGHLLPFLADTSSENKN